MYHNYTANADRSPGLRLLLDLFGYQTGFHSLGTLHHKVSTAVPANETIV